MTGSALEMGNESVVASRSKRNIRLCIFHELLYRLSVPNRGCGLLVQSHMVTGLSKRKYNKWSKDVDLRKSAGQHALIMTNTKYKSRNSKY